jgi:ABC-type oligopeptide transport system substrate-binding subunit
VQIYTCDLDFCIAWAHTVQRDLERIGLGADVHVFPLDQYFARLTTPGEPWDVAPIGYDGDYADPFDFVNALLGPGNLGSFDNPRFEARMTAAAALSGAARDRAYGRLDVDLMRQAAPIVPLYNPTTRELTSSLVQGQLVSPVYDMDLAALQPAS